MALSASASARFQLFEYQRYVIERHAVKAKTGAEIIRQICFQAPPGCESTSNACTVHPSYAEVDWQYHVKWGREKEDQKFRYTVQAIAPEPPPGVTGLPPRNIGKTILWGTLDKDQRKALREHFRKISGTEVGEIRFQRFDKMVEEIAWHESQHVTHGKLYNEALQRIVNTPLLPRDLTADSAKLALAEVQRRVVKDREGRIARALRQTEACAEGFHRSLARPGTYASIVEECVCQGGKACLEKLPAYPPPDYQCKFD